MAVKELTQDELIKHYESMLKKVIREWSGETDALGNSGDAYIEHARKNLEAVKNGRKW